MSTGKRSPSLPEPARIVLAEREVAYQIHRSDRKTVILTVDPEQGLVVRCPKRFSRSRLETILRKKARWILDKQAHAQRLQAQREQRVWKQGMMLPFRGNWYPLHLEPGQRGSILRLEAGHLKLISADTGGFLPPDPGVLRTQLINAYKSIARKDIPSRVQYFQDHLALTPRRVSVREQKRRWGSCSSKGSLNFNWRLVLAPPEVMDYVIVHELCHLRELNHSPRFWAQVGAVLPNYAHCKLWLRENGSGLFL
ncbi:MAG: M48 family metallopeptidase [Deltaproteobacteria bacterium]|nr:M48 family metallopeptidase [Deltaproteobacteria bacterium]